MNVSFPVPTVQKTVGKYAKHIVYYSETEDRSIPTENIGVPNTERGNIVILNVLIQRNSLLCFNSKVKSAYKKSGSSGRSLSRFL